LKLIDTHVHWNVDDFSDDLPQAIARAQSAGVEKFILPGVEKATFASMMNVAERFGGICFPSIGLHPTDVRKDWREELNFVEEQLSASKNIVAIGETGIDCYWSKDFLEEQKIVFEQQMRLSVQYNLPLIIHARDSFDVIFDVLDKVKSLPLRGVFHAYSGSSEMYERILRYGDFKIGIGGVVTFKKAHLADVVAKTDLRNMVLETDAPWLAPVPHRGTRNESSYIPLIVEKIAQLKNCSPEEVAVCTTENAERLFAI